MSQLNFPFCVTILVLAQIVLCGCTKRQVAITPPAPPVTRTGSEEHIRIERPEVRQRVTEYRTVKFSPGEVIVFTAGGCVKTDKDDEKSWKHYVNPAGPEAGRLYHGLVWIPGLTPGLVRIGSVLNRPLTIPSTADPSQLFLRLGYEDDHYGDNGYQRTGNQTSDQCPLTGKDDLAFVEITVNPNSLPSPMALAALDVPLSFGENMIVLNPSWQYQANHVSGDLPDPSTLCDAFPIDSDNVVTINAQTCTSQQPSIDYPDAISLNNAICHIGGLEGKLRGHVNWFPATYAGTINWWHHAIDGDYDFLMVPEKGAGLTKDSQERVELEFDADETINTFGTPWWQSFQFVADNDDPKSDQMIQGDYAIVTGLFGLDNEHEAHVELHPVFSMAIRTKSPSPDEDVWAIFVRNWGGEGYCSQNQHYLDLVNNRFVLTIPWKKEAGFVSSQSIFLTNNKNAMGPNVTPLLENKGIQLTFVLPPPEEGGLIEGELHIQWSGGIATKPLASQAGQHLERTDKGPEAELEKQLTREKRTQYFQMTKPSVRKNHIKPKRLPNVFLATETHVSATVQSALPRPDKPVKDASKVNRDRRRADAYCELVPENAGPKILDACKKNK